LAENRDPQGSFAVSPTEFAQWRVIGMMTFITIATVTDESTGYTFAAGAVRNIGEHECKQYWAYCSPEGESGLVDAIWQASQGQIPPDMTIGDINLALSALGGCRDGTERRGERGGDLFVSAKTSYDITQVEDALVRFYMKIHMHETGAYEKAHTAEEMADHLRRLRIEPVGWAIEWGPYGRSKHGTRLEIYAVEEKGIAEAVWIERTE